MEGLHLCLLLFTFLASVIQCKALCYYYLNRGYYCYSYSYKYYYYYYYSHYWSSTRIIGSAVGGGISLIVVIVVIVLLCRFCNRRTAYTGSTFTTGQSMPTVTTVGTQQQGYSAPYYPQQPGYQPLYTYPTYPTGQQTYPTGQPTGQPPMAGYSNFAYNPPSYEQAAYQTKPNEQPTAPPQ
ncbi:protein shisa-5-like isoform X2 [Mytilus californianus]|uniref:protein shisa-5-like isoform X2 n=1 Tax=Mytilus californianus TaxID=6549 RepID=UPI0022467277|nr:protein shisa-5-like isoform X2 [Mytilus californianus]